LRSGTDISIQARDQAVVISLQEYDRLRGVAIAELEVLSARISAQATARGLTQEKLEQLKRQQGIRKTQAFMFLTYRHTSNMLRHMRTTVRLSDALLERAKREAAKRGITLTALIEQGLRREMAKPAKGIERRRVRLPVCTRGGGTLGGVDLDDSAALLDRMEAHD
jgi:predicted DNA binding CopG/RHH family protein